MDPLPPSIVNSFVQALSYGIYITTFAHCLRWLVYDDKGWGLRKNINWLMLTISTFVSVLATAGLTTVLQMTLAMHQLNSELFNILNTVNSAVEYTTLQLVDAVLIYRCWVVYGHSWWIIILPALLWISSVTLSSYDIYLYSVALNTTSPETYNKLSVLTLQIWDGFFACNIGINIYATSTIIYRILHVANIGAKNTSGWRLAHTCRIIAESGALYTLSTIVNLIATVLLEKDDRFAYFQAVSDPINFSMAGIAFNLILIRVSQQRATDPPANLQLPKTNISTLRFRHGSTRATSTTLSQDPSSP